MKRIYGLKEVNRIRWYYRAYAFAFAAAAVVAWAGMFKLQREIKSAESMRDHVVREKTAIVEACGKAWLKVPLTEEERNLIRGK